MDPPSKAVNFYFDRDLRDKTYATGDVYDTEKVKRYQRDWGKGVDL